MNFQINLTCVEACFESPFLFQFAPLDFPLVLNHPGIIFLILTVTLLVTFTRSVPSLVNLAYFQAGLATNSILFCFLFVKAH